LNEYEHEKHDFPYNLFFSVVLAMIRNELEIKKRSKKSPPSALSVVSAREWREARQCRLETVAQRRLLMNSLQRQFNLNKLTTTLLKTAKIRLGEDDNYDRWYASGNPKGNPCYWISSS